MASSRNLVFRFGALFALVLLISSDVTAADQENVKTTGVQDASSGEVHQDTVTLVSCRHGCCRWIPHKGCKKCCATAEETPEATSGDEDTITADRCSHGCCRWYHGHCQRCCPPAEETPEATSGDEVKN
nr:CYC02 protein-like [Coffea arabica]